jgi:hypothetical protein
LPADACAEAASIEFEASSETLEARVGGIFADQYYLPQWYADYPAGWVEPYQPSTLTARVLDAEGAAVSDCRVEFFSDESSGSGFTEDPVTDAEGEVHALWVAGVAPTQTMSAGVRSPDGWLFAELRGEARRHDEAPLLETAAGRDFTSPSGLVVTPDAGVTSLEARATVTPLTFPPRVSYVAMDIDSLIVEFANGGLADASEVTVSAADRLLILEVFDEGAVEADVIAVLSGGSCFSGDSSIVCSFEDSWEPGETISVRIEAREVAPGEVPADYFDTTTHSTSPCNSSAGCTDYSIWVQRAGGDEVRHAVLRAPIVDDFSDRSVYVTGVYSPDYGVAGSCLETPKGAFVVAHDFLVDGVWEPERAGVSWSFHDTWANQTCANYAAFATDDGYFLSTGGPSPISTPSLPGEVHVLQRD